MTCPTFVEGKSYRPVSSGVRYVFQTGQLHRIPDEATATARGWTDWVDVEPLCIVGFVGAPIARVAGKDPDKPKAGSAYAPLLIGAAAIAGLLVVSGGKRRRR
jgi:hypothetical protein